MISQPKKLTAEFIGTFWLVLGGCGSAVLAAGYPTMGIGFVGVSLAFGLTVLTMAYAIGHVSGCHLNPAVSVGLAVAGRFPAKELPGYIIAQVLGAIAGAGVLYLIASGKAGFDAAGGFASNGYGEHSPDGYSIHAAIICEVVMTMMFLFVILGATHDNAPAGFGPIAIGLCLTLIHLISIPVTNTSVNPARSTGPAIFAGGWALQQLWVFWAAPIAGAILGGIIYKTLAPLSNEIAVQKQESSPRKKAKIAAFAFAAEFLYIRGMELADFMPKPTSRTKPDWIRVKAPNSKEYANTRDLIREHKLNTVCEEAACPNIGECWSKKHATVMILGSVCTRACAFCNIKTGKPDLLDPHEPDNLAAAVGKLGLSHVVITSVDRDDLEDGGAAHFASCIQKLRMSSPNTTIEILTPDFRAKQGAIETVARARPDVYNHNIETVPRLYASIRPGTRYFHSLMLLKRVKELEPQTFTKSGIMLGLGETKEEVLQVMDDLRAAEVDFMTIGQYLQPTPNHAKVDRYVPPDEFEFYVRMAKVKGFLMVSSSPLTRSSYHAGEDFAIMKAERERLLGQAA